VPRDQGEAARALMLDLAPQGFEEAERGDELELAAYTDAAGEARLARAFGGVAAEPVAPGWEGAWRSFHRGIRIGPLWVGPPWAQPPADTTAVVIDPGRAFGTGAHATTRLCVELLLPLERTSLVDLGCGSGVLGIAAARLGFAPVVALDQDPAAVEATRRNARANGVTVDVRAVDVLADPLPKAGVAVANIELGAVERIAARAPARTLVTSGYLAGERPLTPGWQRADRSEAEGWAADRFRRA
jgi:ribosomal protein L11 methyltransferase